MKLAALLAGPSSEQLRVVRAFIVEWYQIPRTEDGLRRTREDALERWRKWQANPGYRRLVPLRRLLDRMGDEKAARVLAFLQDGRWEATNNGAERGARQFRHLQVSCFRLRTGEAIEGAIKAAAWQARAACTEERPKAGRSNRGRHSRILVARPAAA